jgi:putative endonuclease
MESRSGSRPRLWPLRAPFGPQHKVHECNAFVTLCAGCSDSHTGTVVSERQRLGDAAEERVAQYLQQHGCLILTRNFRCRSGELDIVAQHSRLLIVAEVRLRTTQTFGGAAASLTCAKRARILRATRYLLMRRPHLAKLSVRFDALLLDTTDGPIDWIQNAFG